MHDLTGSKQQQTEYKADEKKHHQTTSLITFNKMICYAMHITDHATDNSLWAHFSA